MTLSNLKINESEFKTVRGDITRTVEPGKPQSFTIEVVLEDADQEGDVRAFFDGAVVPIVLPDNVAVASAIVLPTAIEGVKYPKTVTVDILEVLT